MAPVTVKHIERNFDTTQPCFNKHTLPILWPFIISKFHCSKKFDTAIAYSFLILCNSRKYPYTVPPPKKGLFLRPHPTYTPLEIPIKLHKFLFNFFGLTEPEPPSPRKFQSPQWGEYGNFLELHNVYNYVWIYETTLKSSNPRTLFSPWVL